MKKNIVIYRQYNNNKNRRITAGKCIYGDAYFLDAFIMNIILISYQFFKVGNEYGIERGLSNIQSLEAFECVTQSTLWCQLTIKKLLSKQSNNYLQKQYF